MSDIKEQLSHEKCINQLKQIICKQATQIVLMKSRNEELTNVISFLKDKILEYEPSMESQFKTLKL